MSDSGSHALIPSADSTIREQRNQLLRTTLANASSEDNYMSQYEQNKIGKVPDQKPVEQTPDDNPYNYADEEEMSAIMQAQNSQTSATASPVPTAPDVGYIETPVDNSQIPPSPFAYVYTEQLESASETTPLPPQELSPRSEQSLPTDVLVDIYENCIDTLNPESLSGTESAEGDLYRFMRQELARSSDATDNGSAETRKDDISPIPTPSTPPTPIATVDDSIARIKNKFGTETAVQL